MTERKRCLDCKYCDDSGYMAECSHPDVMLWGPVCGYRPAGCSLERNYGMKCGESGKLFEPIPEPDPVPWWKFWR